MPDVTQEPSEKFIPVVVLEHLKATFPKAKLMRMLTWIALHPEEGVVLGNISSLGVPGSAGDPQQVRERSYYYAIKFVARGAIPRVRLRAEKREEKVRLWVEDNGIGIAPEYHARIFGVFERLNRMEDYPGTGMGLAIVARAVERMEGLVGVDSETSRGSRFWIDLADPQSTLAA